MKYIEVEKGQWKTGLDETCLIDGIEFENMMKEMKQEYEVDFRKIIARCRKGIL